MNKRLQTVLAHAGIASRRGAVELIEGGRVKVDGRVVTEKGFRVDPEKSSIEVDGRPVSGEEKKHYFLLNKPAGVISTVVDTHGRKKITDLFGDVRARLYPVGRLDKDTTGLIVVTNDGDLAHRLAHPSFEVEKEYVVTVRGNVSRSDMRRLEKGVKIDGEKTARCTIRRIKLEENGSVYRIRIHEGRKRQVRRMFEAVGGRVTALKRTRYAGLTLGRLKEGEYRELTSREITGLKKGSKNKG